jgi:2-polyprenyl-3-methyl-5-hydroxy-6-metoxy-1,4-benzoquinol methylase
LNGRARCPLCAGDTDPAFTVGDRNRGIGAESFDYRRCRSCRTIFLANVPDDLGSYYPDDYYGMPSLEELDRAGHAEEWKLDFLRAWIERGSIVEIGPAVGIFARVAQKAGFQVTAIEMDARCCTHLEQVVGIRAICSDAPELALAQVGPTSAIVMWHVLEHLPRPWALLERASAQLESGGILALAMPNPHSVQFRLLGARWAHVDAPRHLFLIPLAALQAHADGIGLDLAHVTTSDPAGRHWNWFGWEYALRRHAARRPSTRLTRACALLLTLGLAPLERRGLNGTAYTAVFVKR